jgi:integrase/recombinase XerD
VGRKRKLPDGMVQRPGRKGYYADFRAGGRRIQKRLSSDFDAAKTILNQLKARCDKAEYDLLDNDYPIGELRDSYLKRCEQELRPGTVARYSRGLDAVTIWLGIHKVRQIDTGRVLAYREHRLLSGTSPRTINHDLTVFGAMLRWGVKQKLIGSNPLGEIELLRHDHPKEGRALTPDEIQLLLARSPQPWRDIWYTLLVTGMRKEELANLRFTDIDWESKELIVRGFIAKNRRERRVPIDDGLLSILRRQAEEAPKRQPGKGRTPKITELVRQRFTREHVFVTTQNTPLTHRSGVYHAFMRCCKLAGFQTKTFDAEGKLVEHVDLHSLRRTFATDAITNGADPKSVQEILGHRTLDMTMRIYTKVKAAPKRQAVAKLSYGQGATPPDHVLPLPATGS